MTVEATDRSRRGHRAVVRLWQSDRGRRCGPSAGRMASRRPRSTLAPMHQEATPAPRDVELWPRMTRLVEAAIATALAVMVAFESRPGLTRAGARDRRRDPAGALDLVCVAEKAAVPGARGAHDRCGRRVGVASREVRRGAVLPGDPDRRVSGHRADVAEHRRRRRRRRPCSPGSTWRAGYDGSIVWLLAFGFTWSMMTLLQSRLRLIEQIGERAAFEERQRIARELHDVIAHSLAVTMLHLTGARLALERDPADATSRAARGRATRTSEPRRDPQDDRAPRSR